MAATTDELLLLVLTDVIQAKDRTWTLIPVVGPNLQDHKEGGNKEQSATNWAA